MRNKDIDRLLEEIFLKLTDFELVEKNLRVKGNDSLNLIDGYGSIVLLLSAFQDISDDIKIDNVTHIYVSKLIEEFQKKEEINESIFGGVTGIGMNLLLASREKKKYNNLIQSFNKIIIERCNAFFDYVIEKSGEVSELDYDLMYGVTGQLVYLLNFKDNEEILRLIKKGLGYLVYLTEVDDNNIPRYLIKPANMFFESEAEFYNEGFLNQGISHGVAGILSILAIAKNEGVIVNGQDEAIRDILAFLCEFNHSDEGNTWWYGRVSKQSYLDNFKYAEKNRASWCYGSVGIARAIYLAGKSINDENAKNIGESALIGIAKMRNEEYMLNTSTICHGYAGVLMIMDTMYKETKKIVFKEKVEELVNLLLSEKDESVDFNFISREFDMVTQKFEESIDLGVLVGSTGVILSLLTANETVDMKWKKIFLMN